MKQIVLDTETTGLEPKQGHRIIEIGCVELINRRETKRNFHQYLNPEREIEDGAYNVHGLSNEFLSDKPRFADIAQDFIDFIKDSELIIHNAPFDVGLAIISEIYKNNPENFKFKDDFFDKLYGSSKLRSCFESNNDVNILIKSWVNSRYDKFLLY